MPDATHTVIQTPDGLYCPAGAFHIDPWRPVERAVITHGHSDHARPGHATYLCSPTTAPILRLRCGSDINIQTLPFGKTLELGGATVSLHPAGHILGSAQVRIEVTGHVTVITGDYKTTPAGEDHDPTSEPFELVRCDRLITECTFGLPIYRWPKRQTIIDEVHEFWRTNQADGRTTVLFAYALGKAQRLLGFLDDSIGPILLHGSVNNLLAPYEAAGIPLARAQYATKELAKEHKGRALVIAPPSTDGSSWLRRFAPTGSAFVSGWMLVRGSRRRRSVDRGFALSDHVDWPELLRVIDESGATHISATHGATDIVARYLSETRPLKADEIETRFASTAEEAEEASA
ncbi:MAG: ligase-associated DNA damage response exonuclease [Planctomycetota bacterium]